MRFLLWLAVAYCVYLFLKGRFGARISSSATPASEEPGTETHKDPVCGVYVTGDDSVVGTLEGQRIHFCSMACLEKYREQLSQKQ